MLPKVSNISVWGDAKRGKVAALLKNSSPVLFLGAGVSTTPPAGLPDWLKLRDFTVEAISNQDTFLSQYTKKINDMEMMSRPGNRGMTPEVVASVIEKHTPNYYESLKVLKGGLPNQNHHLIALLAKNNFIRFIITTNYDTYIEQALEHHNVAYKRYRTEKEFKYFELNSDNEFVHVLKVHGCISIPKTITATVEKEARGLSYDRRFVTQWLFRNYPTIFWGYSGYDLKIDLDYFGMESVAKSSPGFAWSFYKHGKYVEPVNEYVEKIADRYQDRAIIGHMLMPDAVKLLEGIDLEKIPRDKQADDVESIELQEQKNQELVRNLQEWGTKSVTSPEACTIFGDLLEINGLYQDALNCYHRALDLLTDTSKVDNQIYIHIAIGKINVSLGSRDIGLKHLEKAESLAIALKDNNSTAKILSELGDYYRQAGEMDAAINYLESAHRVIQNSNNKVETASILDKLSEAYKLNDKRELALEYSKRAEKIWRDVGNKKALSSSLILQGAIYSEWGEFKDAEELFEKAQDILKILGEKDAYDELEYYQARLLVGHDDKKAESILEKVVENSKIKNHMLYADALFMLIRARHNLRRKQDKIQLVNELITFVREMNNKARLVETLIYRAEILRGENPEQTLADLQEALQISENTKLYLFAAISCEMIGDLYLSIFDKKSQAAKYYLKSISFHRQVEQNDEPRIARILSKIHRCYNVSLPNLSKIIEYFSTKHPLMKEVLKSLDNKLDPERKKIFTTLLKTRKRFLDDVEGYAILNTIMRHAQLLGQEALPGKAYNLARGYLLLAGELAEFMSFSHCEAAVLADLGWTWVLEGYNTKGLMMIEKAQAIANELEDFGGEIIYLGNIGYAHGGYGDVEKSIEHLESAIQLAREHHDQDMELRMLLELGVWLKGKKNVDAVKYYLKAIEITSKKGDAKVTAILLFDIGKVYWDSKDYQKALEYRLQGLDILIALNFDPSYIALRQLVIGTLLDEKLNSPVDAIKYFEDAIGYASLANKKEDIEQIHRAYSKVLQKIRKDYHPSYPVYEMLVELLGNDEAAISILRVSAELQNFPSKLFEPGLFSKVLEIRRKSIEKASGYALELYAVNSRKNKEFDIALGYLERAETIARQIGDKTWQGEIMLQRVSILIEIPDVEEALKIYGETEKIAELVDDWEFDGSLINTRINLANKYTELKDVDTALELLVPIRSEVKKRAESFNDGKMDVDTIITLAMVYARAEEFDTALELLIPIRSEIESNGTKETMNFYHKLLFLNANRAIAEKKLINRVRKWVIGFWNNQVKK